MGRTIVKQIRVTRDEAERARNLLDRAAPNQHSTGIARSRVVRSRPSCLGCLTDLAEHRTPRNPIKRRDSRDDRDQAVHDSPVWP
jgi:hypothetical protein